MAVYERHYRRWGGRPTPSWSRFLVIPTYAFKEIFSQRLFTQFYIIACAFWPLVCLTAIYLRYNLKFLESLDLTMDVLPKIDHEFFLHFMQVQGWFAFCVTFIVGPGLISIDLTNNALPYYLSRPLSRFDYILGKTAVLSILLSLITWIPAWSLYLVQSSLSREPFFFQNLRIPLAVFIGSWVWILALSLISLAASACVKKKQPARGILVGLFIVIIPFKNALVEIYNWHAARYLWIWEDIACLWAGLFSLPSSLKVSHAAVVLLLWMGAGIYLLYRKIRPLEIVR